VISGSSVLNKACIFTLGQSYSQGNVLDSQPLPKQFIIVISSFRTGAKKIQEKTPTQ